MRKYPVTAKLRLGWDGDCICVVEMAKRLEEAGAAALCIHARTRAEMYTPGIHPEYIGAVKDTVAVPVIGNGDIFTAADAEALMQTTGCDGVAVGRGALGNPWIFEGNSCHASGKKTTRLRLKANGFTKHSAIFHKW